MVQLVNSINKDLQEPGHEIVLGRWVDSTNSSIAFLTDFRFVGDCHGGVCGSNATLAVPMKAALSGASGSLWGSDYRPHTVCAGYTWLPFAQAGLVYKVDEEVAAFARFLRIS